METDKSEQVRQRAYEIWQEEGCPPGEDLRHWLRAASELEAPEVSAAIGDDLSVLGEQQSTKGKGKATKNGAAAKGTDVRAKGKGAQAGVADSPAVEITTGKEPPRKKIKRTEGP
jgi:hypothetical protein